MDVNHARDETTSGGTKIALGSIYGGQNCMHKNLKQRAIGMID